MTNHTITVYWSSSFALAELALYAVAVSRLGGTRGFTAPIVGQVLVANAATLVGLYGLNQVVTVATGYLARRRRVGSRLRCGSRST